MNRIVGKSRRIVAVGVAAGNRKHPLTNQIVQRVRYLPNLALIAKASGDALGQSQPCIARFQQHCAAIGAAVRLIKLRHQRLVEQIRKQYTLCCAIVSHARASSMVLTLSDNSACTIGRGLCTFNFVNNPG